MAQVVTVSANTAAYVADNMKVLNRVPRYTPVEEAINALAKKVQNSDDHKLRALMTVVKPPALALYFMTSTLYQHPQASWKHVEEAYEEQANRHEHEPA